MFRKVLIISSDYIKSVLRLSTKVANYTTSVSPPHQPVMAREVMEILNPKPNQVFVDMTFGAGGHTKMLLARCPDITVFCLDRDPLSLEYSYKLQAKYGSKIIPIRSKFSEAMEPLTKAGCPTGQVNGIIMDLGVSSMQLDSPDRGFSFMHDAFLDMRMSSSAETNEITASDVLNRLKISELAQIFRVYGGERNAGRIAKSIVDFRSTIGPIQRTKQLANLISSISPVVATRSKYFPKSENSPKSGLIKHMYFHPATRVFQSLRIFVNDELNELCVGVEVAHVLLKPGGTLVVISFHSLEDRLIKWAFTNTLAPKEGGMAQRLALASVQGDGDLRHRDLIECLHAYDHASDYKRDIFWDEVCGPIIPSNEEIMENRRSRSAKLRAAKKSELRI